MVASPSLKKSELKSVLLGFGAIAAVGLFELNKEIFLAQYRATCAEASSGAPASYPPMISWEEGKYISAPIIGLLTYPGNAAAIAWANAQRPAPHSRCAVPADKPLDGG